jgi:uncharacterized protein
VANNSVSLTYCALTKDHGRRSFLWVISRERFFRCAAQLDALFRERETIKGYESALTREIIRVIRNEFRPSWRGLHGAPHWTRVRENGLRLAATTGANTSVIELFAFLHDSQRRNDDSDYDHGKRAAEFAASLAGKLFELSGPDLEDLLMACRGHIDGLCEGSPTVLTCWDADRLDLGRVGIKPHPNRLVLTRLVMRR